MVYKKIKNLIKSIIVLSGLILAVASCMTTNSHAPAPPDRQATARGYEQVDSKPKDLWVELRSHLKLEHHTKHPKVKEQIDKYKKNPDELKKVLEQGAPYKYYIFDKTRKKNLPAEIALIPALESDYNPFAVSNMGAVGLWQFMPGTAHGLGLQRTKSYDGRKDIHASTKAALTYFSYLYKRFNGDWLLAIAAYNAGEGTVLNAIAKNERAGKDTDFWSLRLPRDTSAYTLRLLALAAIIKNPENYAFELAPIENKPHFVEIIPDKPIDLKNAAKLAELSPKHLNYINPAYNKITAPTRNSLLIPSDKAGIFIKKLATSLKG